MFLQHQVTTILNYDKLIALLCYLIYAILGLIVFVIFYENILINYFQQSSKDVWISIIAAIEVSADNIFGNVIQKSSSGLDEPITNTKLPGSQNTLIMFNITHILLGHPHVKHPETFDFHMEAFCLVINVHKNNTCMMILIKFQIDCKVSFPSSESNKFKLNSSPGYMKNISSTCSRLKAICIWIKSRMITTYSDINIIEIYPLFCSLRNISLKHKRNTKSLKYINLHKTINLKSESIDYQVLSVFNLTDNFYILYNIMHNFHCTQIRKLEKNSHSIILSKREVFIFTIKYSYYLILYINNYNQYFKNIIGIFSSSIDFILRILIPQFSESTNLILIV
ncbi:hypothetical protein AGLY_010795 [Aphis glycines]|uniref:Uncharacterized protein n=1 Tax=Aphis glycines TaxID=307491 RepID=A0A6G0TEJ8_APHGL|nr:hypothetical protein AGLY_010795 [Aphis glycines]